MTQATIQHYVRRLNYIINYVGGSEHYSTNVDAPCDAVYMSTLHTLTVAIVNVPLKQSVIDNTNRSRMFLARNETKVNT